MPQQPDYGGRYNNNGGGGQYNNNNNYNNYNNNYNKRRDRPPPPPPPPSKNASGAGLGGYNDDKRDYGQRYDEEDGTLNYNENERGNYRRRRRDDVEEDGLYEDDRSRGRYYDSSDRNNRGRRDYYQDYEEHEEMEEEDTFDPKYPSSRSTTRSRYSSSRDESSGGVRERERPKASSSGRGFFGSLGGNSSSKKGNDDKSSSGSGGLLGHAFNIMGNTGDSNKSKGSGKDIQEEEKQQYNPIDYQFPSREITNNPEQNDEEETSSIPQQDDEVNDDDEKKNKEKKRGSFLRPGPRPGPKLGGLGSGSTSSSSSMPLPGSTKLPPRPGDYASARNDAVARYRSRPLGKVKLSISSFLIGTMTGGFVGQSIMGQNSGGGKTIAILFGILFLFMSMLRNDYGEMSRSLGLGLIYLIRRTKVVRKKYKTGRHIRGMCRLGKRKPFPPAPLNENGEVDSRYENPWKYEPQSDTDPEFDMIKALLSVAMIGSFVGGNIPLIPTWMGGAGGAAAFVTFGIAKNARGDLIRAMGMRVVSLAGEALEINRELNCARKVGRVGGKIFDKMMILDRKHRIKDRIIQGASFVYDRASSTASRVQSDMKERREEDDRDRDIDDFDRRRDYERERRPPPRGARR